MNGVEKLDYTKMCFVVMPFGQKPVGQISFDDKGAPIWIGGVIDFDPIYKEIFAPAIEATPLPEGGNLVPLRTDQNYASANIDTMMFRAIEYSRMVLCDITGLNANVFLELGLRLHSRPTGTAILRQSDGPIPFDINHIKAFPYEFNPADKAAEARAMITRMLTESLKLNLVTSPYQASLDEQRDQPPAVEAALTAAEQMVRDREFEEAILKYDEALKLAPNSPLIAFKLGLMYKYLGNQWVEARDHFALATRLSGDYAAAYRELGIAENKIFNKRKPATAGTPDGEASLRQAIELDPEDFDGIASLGGMLKRAGRKADALAMYEQSARASRGHPYPLLNALKLRANLDGTLVIDDATRFALNRAERIRRNQIKNPIPLDSPWCYFDLSEIRLYLGSDGDFLDLLNEGLYAEGTMAWQATTHRESLELIAGVPEKAAIVKQGINLLATAEALLPA